MFANKVAFITLIAAIMVSASPGHSPSGTFAVGGTWNQTTKKCTVGELSCCNNLQSTKSTNQQTLGGAIGAAFGDINALVSAHCTPISAVIGISGNNCNASPTCCSKNNFNGLVAFGCNPVNANL